MHNKSKSFFPSEDQTKTNLKDRMCWTGMAVISAQSAFTIITSRKNKMQSDALYIAAKNKNYVNIVNVCLNSKWEELER